LADFSAITPLANGVRKNLSLAVAISRQACKINFKAN